MKKIASGIILVFVAGAGFLGKLTMQERPIQRDVARVYSATQAELRELRGFSARRYAWDESAAQVTSDRRILQAMFQGAQILAKIQEDEEAQREDVKKRLGCEVAWVDSTGNWTEVGK